MVNPPMDAPPDCGAPPQKDRIGIETRVLLETGLRNFCVASKRIEGETFFVLTGEAGQAFAVKLATKGGVVGERHTRAAAVCFDSSGKMLWRDDVADSKRNGSVSVFPAFVGHDVSFTAGVDSRESIRLKTIAGKLLWETAIPGGKPWANGSCVVGDFNGDGRLEIVYGTCASVVCIEAQTGDILWVYDDRVAICHGRLAAGDVNGDGREELVFGTEYSDDPGKCLSSMVILDGDGNVLARRDGILGDLGSTPTILADINADGKPEIVHASQNLCWNEPRHPCWIMTFDENLNDVHPPIATGCPRCVVGDMDGDGHVEAVGITDYRDGGPLSEVAVVCADLTAGVITWTTPVQRCWLTGDPVLADLDGDGEAEILLTTNYGSGYAHQPGTRPWSDMMILKADGTVCYTKTFPDMITSPIVLDVDDDGLNEIIAPCYDGSVYLLNTPGKAASVDWPLMQRDSSRRGGSAG